MERFANKAPPNKDEIALDLLKLKIQLQQLKTRFEPMPDDVREQGMKETENEIVDLELKRIQKS